MIEVFPHDHVVDDDKPVKGSLNNHQKLGSAGLALHYANIITQIDTLVSSESYLTLKIVHLSLLVIQFSTLFLKLATTML